MRAGVISDTHLPSRGRSIPAKVYAAFDGVDLILHAGDLVSTPVLEELGAVAPVQAVLGNMDLDEGLRARLPETWIGDLDGVEVVMVHDAGPARGRRDRLQKRFPRARVAIFGHTHEPLIDDDDDLMLLNPGSACDPRGRAQTVALLEVRKGEVSARLVEVDG